MKKRLALVLAFVLCASVAFAVDFGLPARGDVRIMTANPTTHTHVTTYPSLVYGIAIKAKTAGGWAILCDSATTGADSAYTHRTNLLTSGRLKVVISEATQYDSDLQIFNPPLYFKDGIFYGEGTAGTLTTGDGGDGTDTIVYYTGANN